MILFLQLYFYTSLSYNKNCDYAEQNSRFATSLALVSIKKKSREKIVFCETNLFYSTCITFMILFVLLTINSRVLRLKDFIFNWKIFRHFYFYVVYNLYNMFLTFSKFFYRVFIKAEYSRSTALILRALSDVSPVSIGQESSLRSYNIH